MKGLISIYFFLSLLLIIFIGFTPLSFQTDFIRLLDWVVVVSIVFTTLLLLLNAKTKPHFFWRIGLALIIVCLFCLATGVSYHEDMDLYSWRVVRTFDIKLEFSRGIFGFMEIINLLCLPLIILIDIYLWISLVRSF